MYKKCDKIHCNIVGHPPVLKPPPEVEIKKLLTKKELEVHYWIWYNSLDG